MKVLVFGVLTDVIGQSTVELNSAHSSDELLQYLHNTYPFLKNYRFEVFVNQEKIEGNVHLNDTDEVALLPPYSGG